MTGSPAFASRAHEACYGIVGIWLRLLFRDVAEQRDQFVYTTRHENVPVETEIRAWQNPEGVADAIIINRVYIAREVDEPTMLVSGFLNQTNAEIDFGAFGLDGAKRIFFKHSIVGSTCDRLELRTSVMAAAAAGGEYHDEIVARSGGLSAFPEG